MATTTWTQTAGMVSDEDVDNLESYAEQALASKNAAEDSETAAAASETAAATSATNASVSASSAATSASNASTSATSASTSETNASTSATSASTSATAAASSATAAAASETAAGASETAAAASETAAGTSETNAATSETNAATSATSAATSATNAATSATAAAASETNVATDATAAATSATNAATSETNAATSETNASTSETNAATSETNAATSATNAASSATSAASAQTAAESARDATLTAYDNFDDRYLGAKTSDPSVDNDGNALVAGALYFDSTAGAMKVYTGSAWVAAYVSGTSYLPLVGGTLTGTLNFGDNVKAQFGASADLQVYHNGFHSIVADVGSGDLLLRGANVKIQSHDGSSDLLTAFPTGAVNLNYNGSTKLSTTSTGIDVTGTVVADGAQIDLTSSRQLNAQLATSGSGYGAITCVEPSASNLRGLELEGQLLRIGTNSYNQTTSIRRLQINDAGETIFYEETGADAKMRWLPTNERLRFEDTVRASFGAADDMVIYHDGTNSNIENGTGALHIRNSTAGQLKLQAVSGEQSIIATPNAGIELYFDNTKRLETLTDGVNIDGTLYRGKLRSNYNISTNWEDGVSWEWIWGDTGTNSNTWYKVADLTWPTNGTYDGGSFEIQVLTNAGNFGSSVNVQRNHYLLSINVSGAVSLDTDTAYLRGKDGGNSELRAVKTASGTYELQVRAIGNYRGIFIKVFSNVTDAATVTPTDSLTAGSTSGTAYTPTAGTASDSFRHTFNQVEASTVRLGDNNKATFGASDDLEIYHDGTDSYIQDSGTGNLVLTSNFLGVHIKSNTLENMAQFNVNDAVKLYFDNSKKLETTSSGVKVYDRLNVDLIQSSSHGASSELDFDDDVDPFGTGQANFTTLRSVGGLNLVFDTNDNDANGFFIGQNASDTSLADTHFNINGDGDAKFFSTNSGTAKLTWDASDDALRFASGAFVELNGWTITESGGSLYFATGGTNKMKLDASGNLDVVGSVNANATIT